MDTTPPVSSAAGDEASTLMRIATYASVAVAVILIAAKLVAWMMTDSVSLLSTLVDSLIDAAASIVTLVAVRHALRPADREHRFGHGKAESLAGLAQAAFIIGSGAFLIFEAIDRFITPRAVVRGEVGLAVMGIAIVLTILLVVFQSYTVRKTGSVAIKADSMHYRVDVLINAAVMVSIFLSTRYGWYAADPLFALGIVAYLGVGAYRIIRESTDSLMDREFPDEERQKIREIALSHPQVHNVHDMRTRSAGLNSFIQLHLEMDRDMTLYEAHEVADAVMYEVEAAFPGAEVLIHQDPAGIDERRDRITR